MSRLMLDPLAVRPAPPADDPIAQGRPTDSLKPAQTYPTQPYRNKYQRNLVGRFTSNQTNRATTKKTE
jgi:hypothetical protein